MESFFSSLKTERTARKLYRTRDEAKADVFDYVKRFQVRVNETGCRPKLVERGLESLPRCCPDHLLFPFHDFDPFRRGGVKVPWIQVRGEAHFGCFVLFSPSRQRGNQNPGHRREFELKFWPRSLNSSVPKKVGVIEMAFKFPVGHAVEYKPQGQSAGLFEVIRHMPEEDGAAGRKYRIKSLTGCGSLFRKSRLLPASR